MGIKLGAMLRMAMMAGLTAVAGLTAPQVASAAYGCRAGSARCPVAVPLVRGGPARTVHGRIRSPQDRFAYVFRARAGSTLVSRIKGPALRLVITFPGGGAEGPGFAETLKLKQTGRYRITVSPDTMADGILGPFALTLRLR